MKQTKEYREAFKKGALEAAQEIKKGVVTLYTFGLQMSLEHLDKVTGLPIQPIAGCEIDNEILGRSAGHNEAVMEHVKLQGPPPNSFNRWSKDLFDLKEFFDRESKTVHPTPLKPGGRTLKSPDGRFTIRPVQTESKNDDGTIRHCLGIVLGGETLNTTTEEIIWDEGETDLLWGPQGSRFAVIRCKTVKSDYFAFHFQALDLQRGKWLRWEHTTRP